MLRGSCARNDRTPQRGAAHWSFVLTRFLHANRYPLRSKTLLRARHAAAPKNDLIRINDRQLQPGIIAPIQNREVILPFDAMVVGAAVAVMFLAFAGVLLWGDFQTRPDRLKVDTQKRRSS